jgi:alkanesulfonate monooxygenase SsuD/methylene tetrahydromethanopterin reductase-like flavin-dependent oxidoreductase (luciferase family)
MAVSLLNSALAAEIGHLQDGGNARFLNAMVVWGDEAAVRARIREHFDAGATQVCLQPVHPQGDLAGAKAMLTALAP